MEKEIKIAVGDSVFISGYEKPRVTGKVLKVAVHTRRYSEISKQTKNEYMYLVEYIEVSFWGVPTNNVSNWFDEDYIYKVL